MDVKKREGDEKKRGPYESPAKLATFNFFDYFVCFSRSDFFSSAENERKRCEIDAAVWNSLAHN